MKIGYLVAPNSTAAAVLRKRLMNHGAEEVIVDIGTNERAEACLDGLASGDSLYVWNIFHLSKNSQELRDILQRLIDNNITFFVNGDRVNFSLPHVLPEIFDIIDEHEETMRAIKPRLEYFDKIVQKEKAYNPFKELRQQSKMELKVYAEYFGISEKKIVSWEEGKSSCPPYLLELMQYKLKKEKIIK